MVRGLDAFSHLEVVFVFDRVDPDGVEWVLADSPRFRRSSVRPWPWRDAHRAPGLHGSDVDGNGKILSMRIADPNGAWTPWSEDARLMVRVPPEGVPAGTPRYRMLMEGEVEGHDGFTVPTPSSPESLDMNRNFPAGWGTGVKGSGDHPLSEPEIDALVRAVVARRNVCGYNAYHTSGGVLLRPSSTRADSTLPVIDVWAWKELGKKGQALTGYTVHSVYEDFTFDLNDLMSGAADDWAYEHLGVFGWTTEFWDVIQIATGKKSNTDIWYVGPTAEQERAVYEWVKANQPHLYLDWQPFQHPQLGAIEIGGWDELHLWSNAPENMLLAEVKPHAEFAVYQALCSPRLEVLQASATSIGEGVWRVEVGVANTGWLPTYISQHARAKRLVLPTVATLEGAEVLDGIARREIGQLEGRLANRFSYGKNDGTPDRRLVSWVVRGSAGDAVTVQVANERAGSCSVSITL